MAAKLKLNSASGGSVSFKVDDALATDEEVIIPSDGNFGIESGSNANGNWTKFPDGTLMCRGIAIVNGTETSINTYALPFISPPNIVGTGVQSATTTPATFKTNSVTSISFSAMFIINLGGGAENSFSNSDGTYQAIGRWK